MSNQEVIPHSTAAPCIQDPVLVSTLSSFVGACWKSTVKDETTIYTLSNISYAEESEMQSLDVYFPPDYFEKADDTPPLPVYVHIHGGGWSRGGKDSPFYGGPALCQNAVLNGCIAVAPGYRLGNYPDFMEDCAQAIRWVKDNITKLRGDLSNVFLSGHSAGGHIASLLVLRHSTFLKPLDISVDFFKGLILVSGVYDLFSPLRKAPLDSKNKWFFLAYVLPAFGSDEKLRREASPLLLIEPNKETSLFGKLAMSLHRSADSIRKSISEKFSNDGETLDAVMDDSDSPSYDFEINTSHLPNTLILNASFDMGLQENGELMAAAMEKHTDVKYVLVQCTDHASICWNPTAASQINEFVDKLLYASSNS